VVKVVEFFFLTPKTWSFGPIQSVRLSADCRKQMPFVIQQQTPPLWDEIKVWSSMPGFFTIKTNTILSAISTKVFHL